MVLIFADFQISKKYLLEIIVLYSGGIAYIFNILFFNDGKIVKFTTVALTMTCMDYVD